MTFDQTEQRQTKYESGGGIIGAGKDDDVRAAFAFLREADQFLDRIQTVDSGSMPGPGYTRFYVRTPSGSPDGRGTGRRSRQ